MMMVELCDRRESNECVYRSIFLYLIRAAPSVDRYYLNSGQIVEEISDSGMGPQYNEPNEGNISPAGDRDGGKVRYICRDLLP